jgi:hypothetical protein
VSNPRIRFRHFKLALTSSIVGVLFLSVLLAGCSNRGWTAGEAFKNAQLAIKSSHTIVCWGDSMTAGNQGVADFGTYPSLLQAAIGPQIINEGIGGQTSTQIGVRQGGVASYVTVEGGLIPAQGGVTVTFPTGYEPVTLPTRTMKGSIQGVEGVVSLTGYLPTGKFTFTPVAGSKLPVSINGAPRFIPTNPYQSYLPIFWEGRNNLVKTSAGPYGPAQIEADIAAQVATVPNGLDYLVLSVINENGPADRKGGANYPTLIGLNNALAARYGTHFLDVRSLLVNAYNPSSPVDVTDHEYDMVPTSLGAITAEGTLAGNIGPTDTVFKLNVTAGKLIHYHNLVIDNENIRVLAFNGSTVTVCGRGFGGIRAAHAAGARFILRDVTHMNQQGDQIVANAIRTKLGL